MSKIEKLNIHKLFALKGIDTQVSIVDKVNELIDRQNEFEIVFNAFIARFRTASDEVMRRAIENTPELNTGVLIINGKRYRVVPHCKHCIKNLCVMDIDTVNGLSTVVQCQKCGQFLKTFRED